MTTEENPVVSMSGKQGIAGTRVCVMGLGYIGLPTASILANKGYQVWGVDVRPDVVDTINRGQIHIEEPDLDILVRSAVNRPRVWARTVSSGSPGPTRAPSSTRCSTW